MIATTADEIKNLRIAGKILAGVLDDVAALVRPGISTAELDLAGEHAMRSRGAVPAFLNYQPEGAAYPFPAALCISINDEVVHGIPNERRVLERGDLITIDGGLSYKGYFVDSARTLCVGGCDDAARRLMAATTEALQAGISVARVGRHVGDIGAAVSRVAKNHHLSVVEDLGGHGVGKSPHERPYIANDSAQGEGEELVEGLVIAIEPMLAEGKGSIILDEDEWTYRMEDGKRAAHFEHTIIITASGPEILTQ